MFVFWIYSGCFFAEYLNVLEGSRWAGACKTARGLLVGLINPMRKSVDDGLMRGVLSR